MTISRANSGGWSSGDKYTSSQANTMDLNATYAFDIRSGQTATIQSVATCTGQGRILKNYETGTDGNTTYAVADGIEVIDATAITADREYTLSNTGAAAGDESTVRVGSTYSVTVKNNGGTTLYVVGRKNGGRHLWATFRHNGTNWFLHRTGAERQTEAIIRPFRPTEYSSTTHTSGGYISSPTLLPVTSTQLSWSATYGTSIKTATVYTGGTAGYVYRQWLSPADLPQGHQLTSVVATVTGAGGHGGLPQQMPAIAVWGHTIDTALEGLSAGAWGVDASASVVAYEASHTITYTCNAGAACFIDHNTYWYSLWLLGEGGSNAVANLSVLKVVFNFTA